MEHSKLVSRLTVTLGALSLSYMSLLAHAVFLLGFRFQRTPPMDFVAGHFLLYVVLIPGLLGGALSGLGLALYRRRKGARAAVAGTS